MKIINCGYFDLLDDIHLLERLRTGLKSTAKFAQLAMTPQYIPNVTWYSAIEQLTMHECLVPKENKKVHTLTVKPTAKYNGRSAVRSGSLKENNNLDMNLASVARFDRERRIM